MDLIMILDCIGLCSFSISGTLTAINKKFDLFGATVIGFMTAIGGGTIRDLIIGDIPVTWILNDIYQILILLSITFTLIFYKHIIKLKQTLFLFDTIGVSLYTVYGLTLGLNMGLTIPISITLGLLSALGGGVIRDILCNEIPIIFRKELYASICIFGCIFYIILINLGVCGNIAMFITMGLIIVARLLSVKYNISLPKIKID